MEVKVPGAYPLWLVRALDDCGVYPTSFSKYGEAYLACEGKYAPKAYQERSSSTRLLVESTIATKVRNRVMTVHRFARCEARR